MRLQGWATIEPFMKSPQAGHIFETLVLSEIIKFINNYGKNWKVSVWRTKDGEEIDFIIENGKGDVIAMDAKMGIHSVNAVTLPTSFKKSFPKVKTLVIVSFDGKKIWLSKHCLQLPITALAEYLSDF